MRTIPAKSVQYQGIQFRSVEEARWAAFFNRLEINFEYEKQVEGLYYLPDFFVPSQRTFPKATFFEVKPVQDVVEEEKCWMLEKKEKTRVGILRQMQRIIGRSRLFERLAIHEIWGDYNYAFTQCEKCNAYGFEWCGITNRIGCPCTVNWQAPDVHNYESESLLVAYMHATTLRF